MEISAAFQGRDLHLLGCFVDPQTAGLAAALESIRERRSQRFEAIAGRLRASGASLDSEAMRKLQSGSNTLGRRHLARLLVDSKQAGNVNEAFFSLLE